MSQITVDPLGNIINLEAGFRGGMNDTGVYNITELGRGELPMPGWAKILADGGYPSRDPLIIPFTIDEAGDDPFLLTFNEAQRSARVIVEIAIRRMKVYRVLSRIWCHRKYFQATVTQVVACLTNKNWARNRGLREN